MMIIVYVHNRKLCFRTQGDDVLWVHYLEFLFAIDYPIKQYPVSQTYPISAITIRIKYKKEFICEKFLESRR